MKKAKRPSPPPKPSLNPPLKKMRDSAIEAAHAAGAVLAKYFGQSERRLRIREKPGAGLVTNADVEAEAIALKVLKRGFPGFKYLTEESAPDVAASVGPARWVLDPLDGTTNFVHRFPMFCVSIGAEWHGEVVVGVIYHPILRDTYVAVRGQGAYLLQQPGGGRASRVRRLKLECSRTARLEDALLTTGFTYGKSDWLKMEMHAFQRLSGIARAVRRPGSAALDLAYTARGVFDGFWERRLSPWDVAAGSLLVQEAGGTVTDFGGNRFHIEHREILAAGPKLHPLLRQVIAPEFCALDGR
jgi:myo-inositol-1(or 4)-monophosphatase